MIKIAFTTEDSNFAERDIWSTMQLKMVTIVRGRVPM